jgi:N-acetylmuramoyl-L-alanine amidase
MRLAAVLSLFLAAPAGAVVVASPTVSVTPSTPTPWVEVVWPKQGHAYPVLDRSFTFGHATPGSTLVVNGSMIPLEESGAFFTMTAFSTGAFTLKYDAVWQGLFASTEVVVQVGPEGAGEVPAVLGVSPEQDMELRPGGLVVARCRGPEGVRGTFQIKGLTDWLPLAFDAEKRLYEGHYFLQPGDKGENLPVVCSFKTGFFGSAKAEAPGKITVADPRMSRTAVTKRKISKIRSSPSGYSFFQPPGVKFEIVGRTGQLLHARLSEHERALISASSVELLPEGTPPPRGLIGRWVNTIPKDDRVQVRVWATERLPFEVRHTIDPMTFDVRFFNAKQRFDRIRYDPDDGIVKAITWRQESSEVMRLTIETKIDWSWGFDAYYDEKGFFVFEIRRPPDLTRSKNVLAGRRVVIDPGHGPWASATGPLGTTEREAVLEISEEMERILLEAGAEVYMTRRSSDGPPLIDRPFDAWKEYGEVYVSVHLNAFPVTRDPFEKPRGFMNFYYHPQSRPLVDHVHASYQKRHKGELADEFVRWGDLYVCRQTYMPAILTESAYVILPEMERNIRDPKYRTKLAETMVFGVRDFYETYRKKQLASPAEQAAAKR